MNKHNFVNSLFLSLIIFTYGFAQQGTLSADAEFNGVFLDRLKPVKFYHDSQLQSATLKTAFTAGNKTFAAGTVITFFKNGSISSGELQTRFSYNDINFAPGKITFHPNGNVQTGLVEAGSFHRNLILPVNLEVSFRKDGIIERIGSSLTYSYKILGMSVRGSGLELIYDDKLESYSLYRGTIHTPQLAGALMITRDRIGQPLKVEPIVLPMNSTFTFYAKHETSQTQDFEYSSRWYYDGTFIVNGMNFGRTPSLYFKGNRLMAVQVTQSVNVQTYTFSANEVIILDDAGNVIPTQYINPK